MAWFPAGLLAHQGGWDEILFVAAPLVVLAALLALANRRANAALNAGAAPDPDESGDDPANPSTPDPSAP